MSASDNKKTGLLLVNLGSPESPSVPHVRRFLREFLGDPRVVNIPRPLWLLILHLFVLPFRPAKSAHAYQSIWTEQGSPLVVFTRELAALCNTMFGHEQLLIDYAMRYGNPRLRDKLRHFKEQNIDEIVIVPLYPQYSSTTTASIVDVVADELLSWRHMPSLRIIGEYHQNPAYIDALAETVRQHWQSHGRAQLLLMSFHGLPAKLTELGDPYFYHCQTTARLIAERLGLENDAWRLVFQSRFGKAEWLKPYCVEVLQELPGSGYKQLDVICPGFAVDCLETLEEIAITNKEIFISAGGESYRYIPALNATALHAEMINNLLTSR
jgi:protoporphyrin/coproporphyrin ferrochelatase